MDFPNFGGKTMFTFKHTSNGSRMAAWFKEFRNEHGFTSYQDNETPVTVDVALLAVTYFCVLLSVATLIATLGIRGREKWSAALRAGYAVAVGSIILVCLVGHGWQQGDVSIRSPYVYRSNLPFVGSVGLKVALHGSNVTLEGYYRGASGEGYVYYAEEMPWADFGHETERYAHFLHRGLPEPVLKVLEFISVDDGGLRWGRAFHTAGHYANVLLWTAFAFWLVTNLLLFSVVVYGAYMFFFTGLTMVLACVSYHACQLDQPLVIAFGDVDLRISYGWCFWLSLATGCVTLVLGLTLIIFDHFAHDDVAVFFHLERLDQDENLDCEDRKIISKQKTSVAPVIDRRGELLPQVGRDERRGSIFLEPGRKPSHQTEAMLRSLGLAPTPSQVFANGRKLAVFNTSRSACHLSKMATDYSAEEHTKTNPLYSAATEKAEEESSPHMELVYKDKCRSSSKKPSLATMREHRDNHANEKIYASNSHFQYPGKRRVSLSSPDLIENVVSVPGRKISADSDQNGGVTPSVSSRSGRGRHSSVSSDASSAAGIVLSPAAFPFPPPDDSGLSAALFEHHHHRSHQTQSSPDGNMALYSRQNSAGSSCSRQTSAASSVDSGRGVSDSKVSVGGSNSMSSNTSGADSCPDDQPSKLNAVIDSTLASNNQVVVDIESCTL